MSWTVSRAVRTSTGPQFFEDRSLRTTSKPVNPAQHQVEDDRVKSPLCACFRPLLPAPDYRFIARPANHRNQILDD